MTEQELMELSRQAAGCLPEDVRDSLRCENEYRALGVTGYWECFREGYDISWNFWLHESTEACTEILARVLMAPGVLCDLKPNRDGFRIFCRWEVLDTVSAIREGNEGHMDGGYRLYAGPSTIGNDPMLAFRVAVLRALIALKAQS